MGTLFGAHKTGCHLGTFMSRNGAVYGIAPQVHQLASLREAFL